MDPFDPVPTQRAVEAIRSRAVRGYFGSTREQIQLDVHTLLRLLDEVEARAQALLTRIEGRPE